MHIHITFDRQVFRPLDDGLVWQVKWQADPGSHVIQFHTLTEYAKATEAERTALATILVKDMPTGHLGMESVRFAWNVSNAKNLEMIKDACQSAVAHALTHSREATNAHLIDFAKTPWRGWAYDYLRDQVVAKFKAHQAALDKAASESG